MPSYLPRAGHAGGHLRDPFGVLVEDGQIPQDADHHHGQPLTPHRLTGLLWNCTDTMPSTLCSALDLPQGSSYAQGSREYRRSVLAPQIAPS